MYIIQLPSNYNEVKINYDTVVMCWKRRQGKNGYISRNQPIMLLVLSIMLCCSALKIHLLCPILYAAVLLKFTYYAQYYAHEQELLSEYYAFICNFACGIHYM